MFIAAALPRPRFGLDHTEVEQWSVGDVVVRMQLQGLEGGIDCYAPLFLAHHISGRDLVRLSDDDLRGSLGIELDVDQLLLGLIAELDVDHLLVPPQGLAVYIAAGDADSLLLFQHFQRELEVQGVLSRAFEQSYMHQTAERVLSDMQSSKTRVIFDKLQPEFKYELK